MSLGNYPKKKKKAPKVNFGDKPKVHRRKRSEHKQTFIDPDGKIVTEDNIVMSIRRVMSKDPTTFKTLSKRSGLAPSTLSNLYYGDTASPQFRTTAGALRALGYSMVIQRRH